jgi:novel protein kinase C eta type
MSTDMGFDEKMTSFNEKAKDGIMQDIRNSVLVKAVNEDDEVKGAAAKAASLEDFKIIVVLGKGTFGKVFLAEYKTDKKLYAIKVIRKDILIEYN